MCLEIGVCGMLCVLRPAWCCVLCVVGGVLRELCCASGVVSGVSFATYCRK